MNCVNCLAEVTDPNSKILSKVTNEFVPICTACRFAMIAENPPYRTSITLNEEETEKFIERYYK